MQLSGRDGALAAPGQLARALFAELPPEEIPPAGPPDPRRTLPRPADERAFWSAETAPPGRAQDWREPRRQRDTRPTTRTLVIVVLALLVVAGVVVATSKLLHKGSSAPPAAVNHGTSPRSGAIVLKPVSAHGFDALNLADTGNENDSQAQNAINGSPQGWSSQTYASAQLGNLKAGTGLILDMGKPVKLSSITVQLGPPVGADVQIKVGSSATRSAANLQSMPTVASATDIGGTYTFHVTSPATGQYVVIWFTKLPPLPSTGGFMAQILSIIVRGTASSG
jgi:hypothetical protein